MNTCLPLILACHIIEFYLCLKINFDDDFARPQCTRSTWELKLYCLKWCLNLLWMRVEVLIKENSSKVFPSHLGFSKAKFRCAMANFFTYSLWVYVVRHARLWINKILISYLTWGIIAASFNACARSLRSCMCINYLPRAWYELSHDLLWCIKCSCCACILLQLWRAYTKWRWVMKI